MEAETRENRLLTAYCLVTMAATAAWWWGLMSSRLVWEKTVGEAIPFGRVWILLPADVISAFLLPLSIIASLKRPIRATLISLHAGGQGYAFLISVGCAIADPEAYWGVVAMLLSAGTAFAFALRASSQPILWGPFRFVPAQSGPPAVHWRQTLCQTFAMWTVFFGLLPAGLVAIERGLGWQNQPWAWGWTQWTALALFAGAGIEGLRAGRQMCDHGGGTPLPSQGTTKLVTQGPYRYLRNPMAFCSVVQGLCLAYMAASPLVAVYAFLGAVWWEVLVRPIEEEHLRATFGREYEAYCDRVRCWWPSRLAK